MSEELPHNPPARPPSASELANQQLSDHSGSGVDDGRPVEGGRPNPAQPQADSRGDAPTGPAAPSTSPASTPQPTTPAAPAGAPGGPKPPASRSDFGAAPSKAPGAAKAPSPGKGAGPVPSGDPAQAAKAKVDPGAKIGQRYGDERDADGKLTDKAKMARSVDGSSTASSVQRAHQEGGTKAAAVEAGKEGAAHAAQKFSGGLIPKRAARVGVEAAGVAGSKFKMAIKSLPFVPIIAIVVLISLIGGALSSTGTGLNNGIEELSDIDKYIPVPEYLEALQEAALDEDVPWTVMAAITSLSTEAGKFSPYPDDLIDRDPDRDGIRRPNQGTVGGGSGGVNMGGVAVGDIPPIAAAAYINASQKIAQVVPGAVVPPELIAAIGWVESGHGTYRGAAAQPNGNVEPKILGCPLDGTGCGGNTTPMRNKLTDAERQEFGVAGEWDQAVGPHQFLVSTWKGMAQDGNGDGVRSPHNYFDASLGAAYHLLPGRNAANLATDEAARRAGILSYNRSQAYLAKVEAKRAELAPLFAAAGSTGGIVGTPVSAGGPVAVVGDSLCEPGAAADALSGALSGVGAAPTLDCVRGRALQGDGKDAAIRAAGTAPKLVVALGTNDAAGSGAGFAAALDAVMAAAAGKSVLWVNVGTLQPGAAKINADIAAAVGRYPNLRVVDFAAVVAAEPGLLAGDGIHLAGDGYARRAALVAQNMSGAAPGSTSMSVTYPPNPEGLEVAVYPTVTPPIGGDDDPGLGPYLLSRRAVSTEDRLDPQKVRLGRGSASEYLARQLSDAAASARADGWTMKDPDLFWAEAVRRSPLTDPRAARGCKAPAVTAGADTAAQQSVANAISSLWRCHIDASGAFYFITSPDGDPLNGVAASSAAVDEALDVAWAFSQWGSAACDPAAELAGVFPLTQAAFDTYKGGATGDRCDPASNITAAVTGFIAGESVTPGESTAAARSVGDRSSSTGPYNPMVGGWWAMPWALGDTAHLDAFLADGSSGLTPVDNACRAALAEAVISIESGVARDEAVAGTDSAARCSAAEESQVDAELDRQINERIVVLRSETVLVEGGPGDAAYGDIEEGATTTTVVVDEAPVELDRATRDQRAAALEANLSDGSDPFAGGVHASVKRLSSSGLSVPGRPALAVGAGQGGSDDYATWVIKMANAFGGVRPDHTLTSTTSPSNIITEFWGAGTAASMGSLGSDVPYAEQINAAGNANGVDPRMLGAVAKVRSNFDADLVTCARLSNSGEGGILQMLPDLAAQLGVADRCAPDQALAGGAKYLRMLYDQYGEWDLALAAYHWGPANVTANGRDRWPATTSTFVTSVLGVYTEFKARFPDIAASGVLVGNGPVGPEGCPTTAPPNTLRKGAETIGIYEICRQSVLQAPTPEAAKAIIAALSPALLGKFYSQPQRMSPEFSDCSSFVSRAYYAAGVNTLTGGGRYAPTTATYTAGYPWTRFISAGEALPGDLVLEPAPGHVSMQLALGFKVHTNKTGDVSHVTKNYDPATVDKFIRIDPAAAGPAR